MLIKNKFRVSMVAACIVTTLYMVGSYLILIEQPNYLAQVIVKALGTIIVFSVIFNNIRNIQGWNTLIYVIVFCLIGDVLLASLKLTDNPDLMFQLGVGSFFIGYLMLGILLLVKSKAISNSVKLAALVLVSIIGVIQYSTLSVTDEMAVVIIAYIAMTTVLLTGALSYFLIDIKNNAFFFIAGLMFYISDSIIAQNVFGSSPVFAAEVIIMLTYAAGHSCLMLGTSKLAVKNEHDECRVSGI